MITRLGAHVAVLFPTVAGAEKAVLCAPQSISDHRRRRCRTGRRQSQNASEGGRSKIENADGRGDLSVATGGCPPLHSGCPGTVSTQRGNRQGARCGIGPGFVPMHLTLLANRGAVSAFGRTHSTVVVVPRNRVQYGLVLQSCHTMRMERSMGWTSG